MSKVNEYIRKAKQKGYTVDEQGQVFNSKGKPVKGRIREKKRIENRKGKGKGGSISRYHYITIYDPSGSRPIPTHRFIAYLKYGEKALQEGVVTRHLNDNSLDNSWDNIEIGTPHDNYLDAVRNGLSQPKK